MSFTLTRRALQSTTRITTSTTLRLSLRTMSSNPAISNPAKSETENRGPQFGFKERQPEQEEKKVMDDILNLCTFSRHSPISPTSSLRISRFETLTIKVSTYRTTDQLNPISTAYQHYDQKAVFSDPIGIAQGLTEVQAQFK